VDDDEDDMSDGELMEMLSLRSSVLFSSKRERNT
jgi:hypothetical protein